MVVRATLPPKRQAPCRFGASCLHAPENLSLLNTRCHHHHLHHQASSSSVMGSALAGTHLSASDPCGERFFVCSEGFKSSQVKSSQVKSSQVKSSQVKSSQVKSSQVKSSQVKSSQVKSSQVKSSQVKSSQVKSSQVKSSQVKSSQVKSSQVKSSQVKSSHLTVLSRCRINSRVPLVRSGAVSSTLEVAENCARLNMTKNGQKSRSEAR